ncbi:hypothetical protein BV898_11552 [Hypsibius exemplaris]|uniref:Reverse transcriptase RNase H-like domain-containing protein n=1 Tax=Hypsibius exemplaris TaxID=2072580 RepID=A0A1W0WG77_HYPEX|nr:hypothetical protein BV898_11552 [Hypsibius exemplaris]
MNAAQPNYSFTQRECLAIVWTCEKYRYYLLGREVTCYTDHHSLCWLFNFQSPSSLLVRWALRLQEYELRVIHKSGKTHADGDCLSRYPVPVSEEQQLFALKGVDDMHFDGVDMAAEQLKDVWIRETINSMLVVKSVKKEAWTMPSATYSPEPVANPGTCQPPGPPVRPSPFVRSAHSK